MSIFWSCLGSILGGCAVSYFFFDGPDNFTVIYCAIFGLITGLDSALSEIKSSIEAIEDRGETINSYDYECDY